MLTDGHFSKNRNLQQFSKNAKVSHLCHNILCVQGSRLVFQVYVHIVVFILSRKQVILTPCCAVSAMKNTVEMKFAHLEFCPTSISHVDVASKTSWRITHQGTQIWGKDHEAEDRETSPSLKFADELGVISQELTVLSKDCTKLMLFVTE